MFLFVVGCEGNVTEGGKFEKAEDYLIAVDASCVDFRVKT